MPTLDINARTKIYIGGVIADQDEDFVAADFTSQTWVRINGATNLSTIGDSYNLVTSDQIGVGRTKKGKGTANAGSQSLVFDLNMDDAGQVALFAAGTDPNNNYAFKIEWDDAPAGGTPTHRMFIALVMGTPEQYEGANDPKKLNAPLEINSNIVRVAKAEA